MFNFSEMMGKIKEMQERLKEVKSRLDDITVEAESGGGMVRAKANANRKLIQLKIDPDIIDKEDPEMMEDLVIAAVNRALTQAEAAGKEEMESVTKNMIPNIPGLDLGSLGIG